MRITLLFCLLLLSNFAGAQILNIPDPVFKALLVGTTANNQNYPLRAYIGNNRVTIDTNNDGEIQVTEALAIKHLDFYSTTPINVTSLEGIGGFSNLNILVVNNVNLTTLDVTMLPAMSFVNIYDMPFLQSVNVSGLPLLDWVIIEECPAFTTISVQNLPSLTYLDLNNNNLSSLDVSGAPNLIELVCNHNNLQTLTLENNINLKELFCTDNNISTLNTSAIPAVRNLIVSNNNLTTINTSGLADLEWLDISDNNVATLDLSTNIKLHSIVANNAHLNTIDVSNTNAVTLSAKNNFIAYANLKNGKLFVTLELENNPLTMACISDNLGPNHPQVMQSRFSQMGYPSITLSSFCSFSPAGGYNTVTGNLKFDSDNNGCSQEDAAVANARLKMVNGQSTAYYFSSNNGNYTAFTGEGTSTLSYAEGTNLFNAAPASHNLNFTGTGQNDSKSFCLTAPTSVQDLEISIVPLTTAQPGFDAAYKIVYKNKGSIGSLSGTVTLAYNDAMLDVVNTVPSATSNVGGIITWNFTGLEPFETRSTTIVFNINTPGEIPPVVINDVLAYTAAISTSGTDVSPVDNQLTLNQVVTGSFDPNDITCLEGATVDPAMIGEYLHYNINFENVGTAAATFIVVEDDFDTSKFDVDSFRFLSASHEAKVKLVGNKATFRFDNINLGPEEKGNIIFKIRTLPGLQTGASVSNKANIYFDYNLPIETNNANTTFQTLSTGNWAKNESVKVYPNPSAGLVKIEASSVINSIELYDIQGRLLMAQNEGHATSSLDVSGRAKGVYILKVNTEKGLKIERLIKE